MQKNWILSSELKEDLKHQYLTWKLLERKSYSYLWEDESFCSQTFCWSDKAYYIMEASLFYSVYSLGYIYYLT